ncbi:cora-domain-containing protein [Lophium mytilinum]|uniref:Magnesium transporter n=1 Tax=Lophium mytilinum TaxID=390894 RepID=A0A6A6R7E8_9PEZI|nr:cora-domain-containing protein [Lophium mytilinum]
MKPAPLHSLISPSPALLRFLKSQVEFHPSPSALSWCRRAVSTQTHGHASTSSLKPKATPRTRSPTLSASQWPALEPALRPRCQAAILLRTPILETQQYNPFVSSRRPFTSGTRNHAWSLWGGRKEKPVTNHTRSELPPLSGFLGDNGGLGRVLRPTNDLKLRCTEFDESGNVTLVNGEFKKSELIAKYGLLPRDLRKIDASVLPHILVRPSAILLNLLHLRVLIKNNRVLVFDAYGTTDSYSQSQFMYDLEGKLRQKESAANGTLAYEFRALEAVLLSVTQGLESEFEGVSEPVVRVLRELEEDIDRDKLRYLLIYSKKLGTFEQKARLVRDSLTELLEADDDLSSMYLTEKSEGKIRDEDDHTEVEMLLESYHKVADEIVQAAENLVSSIRNTEEIVKAILDANRNSLMLLELRFSIFTLGLGAGTFVAALYGMNLKNFLEESDLGFGAISAWCTLFGVIVCVYGIKHLRKVQRVSMWGEHGVKAKQKRTWPDWGLVGGPGGADRERLGMGVAAERERFAAIAARDKAWAEKAIAKRRKEDGCGPLTKIE